METSNQQQAANSQTNKDLICQACGKKYSEEQAKSLPSRSHIDPNGNKKVHFKCNQCGYELSKKIVPLPELEDIEDPDLKRYIEKLEKI